MNSKIYKLELPEGFSLAARLFSALTVFCLLGFYSQAQFVNIPASGYNNDIIANDGTATSNTASTGTLPGLTQPTIGVDGNGPSAYAFVASDYKWWSGGTLATCGLVSNGTIASALTPGLNYQLQSTTAVNALTVGSNTYSGSVWPTTGSLTLSTPKSYANLYVPVAQLTKGSV
jgi:hypothetical protein